jgi:DNA-binding CsgD family transcriptional regulator
MCSEVEVMSAQSVADLLHLIVDHCRKPHSHLGHDGLETEDVLLDIEMDGARYLLVRMSPPNARAPLSPREHEIVRMVAAGHPNKTIAAVLNISPWTVCTYLRRIFAKLGVTSRAAMVARTTEIGWAREKVGGNLRLPDAKPFNQPKGHGRCRAPSPDDSLRPRNSAATNAVRR